MLKSKTLTLAAAAALAGLLLAASPAPAQQPETRTESGQPCWVIKSDQVELAVTQLGGQMAPVTFYKGDKDPVRPYYISPWQGEKLKVDAPVLESLRGDFFCMPFGANDVAFKGEKFPPHGEMVGAPWTLVGSEKKGAVTTLKMAFETKVRPGKLNQSLSLVDGQNAVYWKTSIDGFKGKTTVAHHAILAMPQKAHALLVSCTPFKLGMVCPYQFSDPTKKEYQSLEIGAKFTSLAKVPSLFKGAPAADCSSFPTEPGFANLLQVFNSPAKSKTPLWLAAVNTESNYLWFSLKDPQVMPDRIFWMENHGRHGSPWNGRNNCLGLEDGAMYFNNGNADSVVPNLATRQGLKTCIELKGDKPFDVNFIEGAVKVPAGFGRVKTATFKPGEVVFANAKGQTVSAKVNHEFVFSGQLAK